jgi:SAM-dependent methyltransferase
MTRVVSMVRIADILDGSTAYRLWQMPFARAKLGPILRHNDLATMKRVLDVGCGPGTNTGFFGHADYVGIDLNPRYIEYARQQFQREFIVADVCQYLPDDDERFDFVLANSFFHHIDEQNTLRILSRLNDLVAPGGHVHILDLVLPERRSISRWLADNDRGDYPRSLDHWKGIFGQHFEPVIFEPYAVKSLGLPLWEMVYFKGKPRTARTSVEP